MAAAAAGTHLPDIDFDAKDMATALSRADIRAPLTTDGLLAAASASLPEPIRELRLASLAVTGEGAAPTVCSGRQCMTGGQ